LLERELGPSKVRTLRQELPSLEDLENGCATFYFVDYALNRVLSVLEIDCVLRQAGESVIASEDRLSDALLMKLLLALNYRFMLQVIPRITLRLFGVS